MSCLDLIVNEPWIALAVAVTFLAVFVAGWLVLEWLIPPPPTTHRSKDSGDDDQPWAAGLVPAFSVITPGEAFEWLGLIWLFVIVLLIVWAFWSYFGHRVLRKCDHEDAHGRSLMYRERRQVGSVEDVMNWVCPRCGAAVPVIDRSQDDHRLAITSGAVRTAHAQPKASVKRVVNGGFAERVKR